jgi:hypothetical protein
MVNGKAESLPKFKNSADAIVLRAYSASIAFLKAYSGVWTRLKLMTFI